MSQALSVLLRGVIDYAGLFPPASLGMADGVQRYAAYRASSEREMLARFVVPAARLGELAETRSLVRSDRGTHVWPLAVLARGEDAGMLAEFERGHGGEFVIEVIEAKGETVAAIDALAAAFVERTVYVEIPTAMDPEPLVAALARRGLRAKIRMGGVVPEAFPAPNEVMAFLRACVAHGVPFKATAGLHHPVCGEYALTYAQESARAPMYGFLNVLLTAAFLCAGYDAQEVAPLLEERDATAIMVGDAGVQWRGLQVTVEQLARARRQLVGSVGSCSFEEPVGDLRALDFLARG